MPERDPGSLGEFLGGLLDTSDFPARWQCGDWSSFDGWVHIGADLATFGAYFTIPLVILYFMLRSRDLPFPRVGLLFAAFIFACGTTHLIEATLFWHPWYRLSGLAKVATATVSWVTIGALVTTLPQALELPARAALTGQLEREVAEHERTSAKLEERNVDLDRFASAAAHDLQAPLRGMYLLSEFIEEDDGGKLSDESRKHLQSLRERALQMQRMVDGLLKYARVGADGLERESIESEKLVRETWDQIAPPAGFELQIESPMPTVSGARAPLQRVFHNLLANAVAHHDRDRGRIKVRARRVDGALRFDVEDDGPGIPSEHRERIFDMFSNVPGRTTGVGMGLALASREVGGRGGKLWVEPVEPRGTRMSFIWTTDARRPQSAEAAS